MKLKQNKNYSLMNDIYFSAALNDNINVTTDIIKTVLSIDDISITKVTTQKRISQINSKSLVLDLYAKDINNNVYNIEIQRIKQKDLFKRTRYHQDLIDVYNLKRGFKPDNLPTTYIIFFCLFDIFEKNKPLYKVEKYISYDGGKLPFNDNTNLIFINCKYKDEKTNLGKLIHDMTCTRDKVRWYNSIKEIKEGEIKMGYYAEKIRKQGFKEGKEKGYINAQNTFILNAFNAGVDIETISKICNTSIKEVIEIKEKNKK